MDGTVIALKPGAALVEENGQTGLALGGKRRMAKSGPQAAALRALASGGQPAEKLAELMRLRIGPENGAAAALALAELILEFGDYLEP